MEVIQNTKTEERIRYLDVLRTAATLAVMMLHLSATGYKAAPEGSAAQVICWCYNFLSRFAVPVFVMISGAIFLNPDRAVTPEKLLKRNIPRLLLIFFLWSTGFALLQAAREQPLFSTAYCLCVIRKIITGHYHMWYLYMIMGLYLAVPFLRPVAADRTLLKQFMLLCFLLGSIPRLLCLIPVAGEVVREVLEKADIGFFAGYAGYFCLGHYLHSTRISRRSVTVFAVLAAALMLAVAAFEMRGNLTERLLQEKIPYIAVYSAAVFLVFKENTARFERSEKLKKLIEKLAVCSLGMYLVHPAVNFLLSAIGLHALTFMPLFCVPLCGLLVFGISFVIVVYMKKCPLLNKMV